MDYPKLRKNNPVINFILCGLNRQSAVLDILSYCILSTIQATKNKKSQQIRGIPGEEKTNLLTI